jgi:hypothetical protein
MKIALCTTTIHTPHALKLMRKCSEDVRFFVAGDRKTPKEVYELVLSLGYNSTVCLPESGHKWKCSEAIGWNTLARRNIAFLDALKWGADVIYSWDNDNVPVGLDHFERIDHTFDTYGGNRHFNGIKVTGDKGWFDPGQLLIPATRHRGFPHNKPVSKQAHPVVDARVGVAAGLVIGDPDCDASTRIEKKPDIGQVHILGSTGVVVDLHTWTVWNSQNSAMIRELIPAWFMAPGCQRHDDIFASQIVQRVMRERGYHVHFGPPFTFQQRNRHDLLVDLRAEIDGMGTVTKMAELLDSIVLPAKSVVGDTRIIYNALVHAKWYPTVAVQAAMAWLEDCESVL